MRTVLAVLALCACKATAPLLPSDAEAVIAQARRLLETEQPEAARDLLADHAATQFSPQQRAQRSVLLGRAHLLLDDPWETYLALRDFADDHPHSELRDQVIGLEFEAGRALSQSSAGFLFFWSDRRGARTCLEHLVSRYPSAEQIPDALRILGELALEDRDYQGAEDRFRELLRRHPESEWAALARFRFAMSIFLALRGPDYDLDKMESATKELRVFLQNPPENPTFVLEAQQALATLLSWRAERHLRVADFYRTVDNGPGELLHLRAAAAPEFAHTEAAEQARQRLGATGEAMPIAPAQGGSR